MITIQFNGIGRDKKSWRKTYLRAIDADEIAREAKVHGRLMSSDVDAAFDNTGAKGWILVGGWREVGTFEVVRDEAS